MKQKKARRRKKNNHIDYPLVIVILALLAIGVVMVFSASAYTSFVKTGNKYEYLQSQGMYAILGLVVMFAVSKIDYHFWGNILPIIMVGGLVLLGAVFVPGLSYSAKGATRWIKIPGLPTIQPAEFIKILVVIFIAKVASEKEKRGKPKEKPGFFFEFMDTVGIYLIVVGIYVALIFIQPNKSMAFNILLIAGAMIFLSGARWRYLLPIIGLGLVGGIAIIFKDGYSTDRITAYLNPWSDPLNTGYQAIQSLLALGSGGLFGVGLGNSRQKFFYIPEAQNDFIFAIIGEELGFMGCALVILLFALLIWRGTLISFYAEDTFGRLMAMGITLTVAIQVVLNIGVVTTLIPTTGVTLPLISSGGSALVIMLATLGILLNISKTSKRNRS